MALSVTNQQIVAALQAAAPAAGGDASLQQAGDRFKAMMQNPRMAPPNRGDDMSNNIIAQMAASQDAEIQKSVNDVVALSSQANSMSVQEMTAAAMKATLELASTQLDMEAKMGVVNSSKSSVETLMKNQ
ncbi:type III secretion protein HrpB2 [Paraburkholderia phenoliruptrix]|uniref:type III secretion protein HrpB2 n=1 Tax=Paraburkholderia phenoliruptrix TaxID=252970 RepID=UPI001C6F1B9D|nr:type III secretion protein HrpB2 [Paraburkholderia phenoliruptrix]MBW9102107.1 type III secretion protein HrpB2 [Paraburkholderia phenoliruptrix]MBW9131218.1 type III secretion protein HrpB2 [Paraburkholderia ginsengiterrae]